jgi:hypothetical protein
MSTLWELAEAAHQRLDSMTDGERASLLALLDVRVTLTGTSACPGCDGKGKLGGRRGGRRCERRYGPRELVI